jgi:SAM-dependent methyltransferase
MRADVSGVLACPRCGGGLCLEAAATEPDGHIMEGTLTCAACARAYPIARGVPRLVDDPVSGAVRETVDAFGYQWRRATALDASEFGSARTLLDFIHPVPADWFAGRTVLDGGCGSGRFTAVAAALGARLAVGVDLSSSVDLAFARTRLLANALIVQGDMLRLPLARVFDYAFSVGVLHHTADPRAAFLQMASSVVPGGGVSAWVYGAENNEWVIRLLNPLRRITSRLPRGLLLVLAHLAAVPLTVAVKGVYGPVSRRDGLAWLRARLFYFDYLAHLDRFGYREHAFIVFDHAVPSIAEYIPRETFAEWFQAAGLDEVTITDRAANSWRGFGRVKGEGIG